MPTQQQNRNYNVMSKTCRSLAGWVTLVIWLFMFIAGSAKVNAALAKFGKTSKTILLAADGGNGLLADSTEPLSLPEDPETYFAGSADQTDVDKKVCVDTSIIQSWALRQITEIQAVQSFQYSQSIHQYIRIPLFVLQHSWKSYLS